MPDFLLPTWPATLPLSPLLSSYSEQYKSLTKAVTSDNKSLLVRRFATRLQNPIKVTFILTNQQIEYLEKFYYDTLDGGAIRFTFEHPRTKKQIECTFDPTQDTAFTIETIEKFDYYRVQAQMVIWD